MAWLDNGTYVTQYQYNGLSERVIKEIGQDTYLYYYNTAGQLLETQYYQGATQVWSKQIIWLGSLPLAQVTQNAAGSEIVYLHADHLNTPRKATNEQQVVWQWSSDAYGNGAANEDMDGDQQLTQIDLRFSGQIFDAEYNYYRYYDPKTGRYITSDPIGLAGGINTFAYVGGSPVRRVDTNGLSYEEAWDVIKRYEGFDGVVTVWHADTARDIAEDASVDYFRDNNVPKNVWNMSSNGGVADAIRHCVWTCEMTSKLGYEKANFIASNHERYNGRMSTLQDEYNNQIRCWLGEQRPDGQSCTDACISNKRFLIDNNRHHPSDVSPLGDARW